MFFYSFFFEKNYSGSTGRSIFFVAFLTKSTVDLLGAEMFFGEAQIVQWNEKSKEAKAQQKKKSLEIKRLTVSYLLCIILK